MTLLYALKISCEVELLRQLQWPKALAEVSPRKERTSVEVFANCAKRSKPDLWLRAPFFRPQDGEPGSFFPPPQPSPGPSGVSTLLPPSCHIKRMPKRSVYDRRWCRGVRVEVGIRNNPAIVLPRHSRW